LPFRSRLLLHPQNSVRQRKLTCGEGHADLSDRLADYGTGLAQDYYNEKATFYGGLEMRDLLLTSAIILAGLFSYARGMHITARALLIQKMRGSTE
jgi:hypothetical protein